MCTSTHVRRFSIGLMLLLLLACGMQASAGILPITTPPVGQSLPTGWSFTSQTATNASAAFSNYPTNHIAVRVYNPDPWELKYAATPFAAQPGQVWTLSAIIGGRSLGRTGASGYGLSFGVVALNSSGAVIGNYPTSVSYENGSFDWKRKSITIVAPAGTASLYPRIFGQGGGELFVASAAFEKTTFPTITTPNPGSTTPTDWTKWEQSPGTINFQYCHDLLEYINVTMSGTGSWEVGAANSMYAVQPGQVWTFSAMVNGYDLGLGGGGSGLGIVAYDSADNVVTYDLGTAPMWTGDAPGWQATSVTATIPTGVAKIRPRLTGWGGGTINFSYLNCRRAFPPIVQPDQGQSIPPHWFFWQEYAGTATPSYLTTPTPHINVNVTSNGQFEIGADSPYFAVEPGQEYVFSAEISATSLGSGGYGVAQSIIAYDASFNAIDWSLGGLIYESGTFSWKTVTKSVTIPAGAAYIRPRFYVRDSNGGQLKIRAASLERVNYPLALSVPATSLPPVTSTLSPITVPDNRGLPTGWSRWSQSYDAREESTSNEPVPHMAFRYYGYNLLGITQQNTFSVQAGQVWTFSAVMSGRNLAGNGVTLNLVGYDGGGNVVNWAIGGDSWMSGTFDWQLVSKTITVPTGVVSIVPRFVGLGTGEFFVNAATFLRSSDPAGLTVPVAAIPPTIVFPPTIQVLDASTYQLLPWGWKFWTDSPAKSAAQASSTPVTHLATRIFNTGQWELGFERTFPVQPGDTWTFTGVVSRRALTQYPGSTTGVAFVTHDSAGNVIDYNAGVQWYSGSFNWQNIHATITVPAGVASVRPRFVGVGGCEFFVSSVAVQKTNVAADLYVPTASTPAAGQNEIEVIPIELSSFGRSWQGMHAAGETMTWTVYPNAPYTGTVNYTIVDLAGTQYASGTVALGGTVNFNATVRNYYELRITGTITYSDVTKEIRGRSSAILIPWPSTWSVGCNPFGMQAALGDWVYQRMGASWDRILYYNILTGSHDTLPTDFTAYANAWETEARNGFPNGGFPSLNPGVVEVWNEPEGELTGAWTMTQFVNMVSAVRQGINRVNPSVKVAVNFINTETFSSFHAAGGVGTYNVMALHPYSRQLYTGAPFAQSPEADQLLQRLADARTLLNNEGASSVEIWTTEFGWPTCPGYAWSATELTQARFIVRSSLIQLASGLKRVNPFRAGDVPQWDPKNGSFGLSRYDGSPKPAVAAYAVMAQTINNLPYAGRFNMGTNIGAYLFGNSTQTVIALWRPDTTGNITLTLPTGTKTIVDTFGATSTTTATSWTRSIGPSPVYLVISGKSPSQVATSAGRTLLTGTPPASMFNVTQ